jgi:hypothetical protein
MGGGEGDVGAGERTVLGVVDDALELREDGRASVGGWEEAQEKEESKECRVLSRRTMHNGLRGQRGRDEGMACRYGASNAGEEA